MSMLISTSLIVVFCTLIIFQNLESIHCFFDPNVCSVNYYIGDRLFISCIISALGCSLITLVLVILILKEERSIKLNRLLLVITLTSIALMISSILATIIYESLVKFFSAKEMGILLFLTIISGLGLYVSIRSVDISQDHELNTSGIIAVLSLQCYIIVYLIPRL